VFVFAFGFEGRVGVLEKGFPRACALRCAELKGWASCAVVVAGRRGRGGVASEVFRAAAAVWEEEEGEFWNGEGGIIVCAFWFLRPWLGLQKVRLMEVDLLGRGRVG
jgi:hypothetical protein